MRCDIIIPIWNQLDYTKACIDSIAANTKYPFRLILVDNASAPETASYLDEVIRTKVIPAILIRNGENTGFVKAVNQGMAASDAPYLCIMNNDTIAAPGWLERMIDFAIAHPDAGLINPQCSGHGAMPIEEYAARLGKNAGRYMEMNQCQGFCMLVTRALIDKIGLLDEAFGIGGYDDTDYSMRAHLAGYRSVAIADAYVYHRLHASFDKAGNREEWVKRNERIYYEKWGRHLRVGIAVSAGSDPRALLGRLIPFAYGLAREWAWVHIWLRTPLSKAKVSELVEQVSGKIGLQPHQNIRIMPIAGPGPIFDVIIAGKLLERLRKKMRDKQFDAFIDLAGAAGVFAPLAARATGLPVMGMQLPADATCLAKGRETALALKKGRGGSG